MGLGIVFVIIGIAFFPFGVIYFKETWNEYKQTKPNKKKALLMLEIVDVFTSPTLSTWLIFISLLFIILGTFIILLNIN